MQGMNSVRSYTSNNIKPILEARSDDKSQFIPETVPAFAAGQVFQEFRGDGEYKNFFYKEATINPTNPKDKADDFEMRLIRKFHLLPSGGELSGYRTKNGKNFFFISRPLAVRDFSCLECHGSPADAPKSLLAIYGSEGGFNWQMNEIVTAQTIYVPVDEVTARRTRYLVFYLGIFVTIFTLVVAAIGSLLKRSVIEPIGRLTAIARQISLYGAREEGLRAFQRPELKLISTRDDEPGQLTRAFHHMTRQVIRREKNLASQVEQRTAQLAETAREAEKAKAKAEAANRTKSLFLSNMNHELRTPLNIILGFTQLLFRYQGLDAQQRNYLDAIGRSGEHLLTLINDVLEMSKIEAGHITLNESDFSLVEMLNSLERMLSLKAESKGVHLLFELAPDLPVHVHGDGGKLRQVLLNLLTNGIKFTEEGSVTLRATSRGNKLYFEVQDTGSGIAPSDIGSLFEAFVQTETGRKSQEGTGLGLSISQSFVNLMAGKIEVESEVGIGSIFRFSIPAQIVEALPNSTSNRREVIGLRSGQTDYRILVAEDRLENRRLLVGLLTSAGFAVQEAVDGEATVTLWRSWQPHLVWMDLRMPVLNGYAATKRIRELEKGMGVSKTIIIALTGSAFAESRDYALSIGCDDFVAKPFSTATIFDKMAEYLHLDYVYREDEEERDDSPSLQGVSLELLQRIHLCALKADGREIIDLIGTVESVNPHLASILRRWVDEFAYEKIVELLENPG